MPVRATAVKIVQTPNQGFVVRGEYDCAWVILDSFKTKEEAEILYNFLRKWPELTKLAVQLSGP